MINVFATVLSASGGGEYFILGGFNFQGENPKSYLRWIYLVMATYLFPCLRHGLMFGLIQGEAEYLTILVGPNNDGLCALLSS
jgi:hypothetical protein